MAGRQQQLSPQRHPKKLQLLPWGKAGDRVARRSHSPSSPSSCIYPMRGPHFFFLLPKKTAESISALALLRCQGATRSSSQGTPGTPGLLLPCPSHGYPRVASPLPTKGHGDGLQLPPAATDVSAFRGQRKLYEVFPPFRGGMPKQSRNGKYITLLTFPNQEGNTAVGLLESIHGA